MDGREFYRMVDADPELEIVDCVMGVTPADDYVAVRYLPYGGGTRIPMRAILETPVGQLMAILKFARAPEIMRKRNCGCSVEHADSVRMVCRVASAA